MFMGGAYNGLFIKDRFKGYLNSHERALSIREEILNLNQFIE